MTAAASFWATRWSAAGGRSAGCSLSAGVHEEEPSGVGAYCYLPRGGQSEAGSADFCGNDNIGIRRARMERTVLPRSRYVVHTAYGDVAVKRCLLENGERCYVEYDSAAKLAQEQGVPLQDIYLAAQLAQKNIN